MKTKILIILFFLLSSPLPGLCLDAQVQVDKNTITLEDFISYQVIVEGSSAHIDVSAITDFKVDPAGTSTSVSIINGKYEKKIIYQYRLFPLQTGDLVIPSLRVTADGKTTETQKILIKVSDQAPQHSLKQDIFATASISGDHLYVGQQSVYTFKLYSTLQFARATLSEPLFTGFEAKQAGERKNYAARVNGRVFNVSEINFVLIPQKKGPFEIEPSVVTADVVVKDRQDPFGSLFADSFFSSSRTRPAKISTEPIHGRVDALPPYTGSESYSGLVGTFDIKAGIDKTRMKTGESATLTLRISGTGNIMDSAVPRIDLDHASFKVYDDTPAEEVTITPEGYSGFREFKKALVPARPGTFEIPLVSLTYFDIGDHQYKTIVTEPISLTVDTSTLDPVEDESDKTAFRPLFQKQSVQFKQKDILTIKENFETTRSREQMPFFIFWIGLVLPGLFFFCFRGILFLKRKQKSGSELMEKRSLASLKKARTIPPEKPEFLTYLYTALISKILTKNNMTGESLTIHEASDILTRAGHQQEDIRQVTDMIEAIESAKFSGIAIDKHVGADLLEKTGRLIKTLSILLCAGLIFTSALPLTANANDAAMTFLEGIRSYHAQEYEAAAGHFEALAATGIRNGHLYYNIGNAYLKADDIGRAILWYERAMKLIPNDPDLIFNLDYANTLIKDKKEPPGVTITDVLFFWMKFLPLNAIQIAAILCSSVFFLFAGIQAFQKKPVFKTTGIILGLVFLAASCCALYDYYRQSSVIQAVVIEDMAAVRSGLSADATRLFELNAGTRVDVQDQTPTHLKIFFSTGKIGWISKQKIQII